MSVPGDKLPISLHPRRLLTAINRKLAPSYHAVFKDGYIYTLTDARTGKEKKLVLPQLEEFARRIGVLAPWRKRLYITHK